MKSPHSPGHSTTRRVGRWLPHDRTALSTWLKKTIAEAEEKKEKTRFHPVVEEFKVLIESDPVLYMYFTQMFQEQPSFPAPAGSGDINPSYSPG